MNIQHLIDYLCANIDNIPPNEDGRIEVLLNQQELYTIIQALRNLA